MKVKFAPGFQKSMDKMVHWKYAPLRWWKSFLYQPRRFKYAMQRMWRGYGDNDVWDFDSYLSEVIIGGVKELRKWKDGHPAHLKDVETWHKILDEIIDGFEAHKEMCSNDYFVEDSNGKYDKQNSKILEARMQKRFDKGMKLFHKYYFNLWD